MVLKHRSPAAHVGSHSPPGATDPTPEALCLPHAGSCRGTCSEGTGRLLSWGTQRRWGRHWATVWLPCHSQGSPQKAPETFMFSPERSVPIRPWGLFALHRTWRTRLLPTPCRLEACVAHESIFPMSIPGLGGEVPSPWSWGSRGSRSRAPLSLDVLWAPCSLYCPSIFATHTHTHTPPVRLAWWPAEPYTDDME